MDRVGEIQMLRGGDLVECRTRDEDLAHIDLELSAVLDAPGWRLTDLFHAVIAPLKASFSALACDLD